MAGLVITDLLVFGNRDTWRTYSPDDYADRLAACRVRPHDVVVVGGSVVSEAIDPRVLRGLRWRETDLDDVFNLGLPGGTASEAWHAVRHGVVRPPRLLIIGLTATDINDARQEPNGPRVLMNTADVLEWVQTRPDSAEWVVRHFITGRLSRLWSLFRYREGIRLWAAHAVDGRWPGAFPGAAAEAHDNRVRAHALLRGDGFAPRPSIREGRFDLLKRIAPEAGPLGFLKDFRVNGGHLRSVERLLVWARESRVDAVVLDMPVAADLDGRLRPGEFASFRHVIDALARRHDVPVLRADRAAVGLTDAHFSDLFHLNAEGGRRLSHWLRRRLERDP